MSAIGLIGAGIAGGSLLKSILDRPSYNAPDISGELAKISALFSQLRAAQEANINRQAGLGRAQAANNLAARGTLSSPVSENTFSALERDRLNAIAMGNAELGGQEAGLRARLLGQLMGQDFNAGLLRNQANADIWGNVAGLGSSLLFADLLRNNNGSNRIPTDRSYAGVGSINYNPPGNYTGPGSLNFSGYAPPNFNFSAARLYGLR